MMIYEPCDLSSVVKRLRLTKYIGVRTQFFTIADDVLV